MNERIKELTSQAGGFHNHGYERGEPIDRVIFSVDALEKFAELIVKECAEIADDKAPKDPWAVGIKLKEHFGVEE